MHDNLFWPVYVRCTARHVASESIFRHAQFLLPLFILTTQYWDVMVIR